MSDALDFRWATPEDLPAYEAFLAEAYGPRSVQTTPRRARWLFWENPLGLHVALCLHQDAIVGACGHLPYPVMLGGRPALAAFGVDMMVARRMRRRGIAGQLLSMRLERFPLSLSSGQSEGMAAVYGKLRTRDLGAVQLARWRRRLPGAAPPRQFAGHLAAWLRPRLHARPRSARREPLALEAAATQADTLVRDEARPASAGTWAAWIRWRYGGPVYRDHQCWQIATGRAATGVLITRRDGDREHVLDLFAPASEVPALLAAAARTTTSAEVQVAAAGPALTVGLGAAGYLVRPRRTRFLAVMAGEAAPQDLSALNLWAGASDTDLLRAPAG